MTDTPENPSYDLASMRIAIPLSNGVSDSPDYEMVISRKSYGLRLGLNPKTPEARGRLEHAYNKCVNGTPISFSSLFEADFPEDGMYYGDIGFHSIAQLKSKIHLEASPYITPPKNIMQELGIVAKIDAEHEKNLRGFLFDEPKVKGADIARQ
jgi:hypothetical protein